MNGNKFEERLIRAGIDFHKVVPYNENDKIITLDFTDNNTELNDEILTDTEKFSDYINNKLHAVGATYGIGGYNEHRTIYSRSRVFDAPNDEEPRRLHLGTDIWGAAGTPVYAPLAGTVHSFAFNDAYGDYGATIILQHDVDGLIFHTLYGHLSLDSIQNLKEGQEVAKGDFIATFGMPEENGHWPPHLHFQLIIDMEEKKGDYPGVCKFSEREKYLSNCPDPKLLLTIYDSGL